MYGRGWDSAVALVIAVCPPQTGIGIHDQGCLGVSIAGCHSGDGREKVAAFWPSVCCCQSGSNQLHFSKPARVQSGTTGPESK